MNRGRAGLPLPAVAIGGVVIELKWLKVSRRMRLVVGLTAMPLPGFILLRWVMSLIENPV